MRLCERPGCSDPAGVQYGVDMSQLLLWLEPLAGDPEYGWGALCRRHADAMVVPRGWSLDDRREPVPRLFRSQPTEPTEPKRRTRRARAAKVAVPPTPLPIEPQPVAPPLPAAPAAPAAPARPAAAALPAAARPTAARPAPAAPAVRVVDPLPQTVAADNAAAAAAIVAATAPGGIPRPWQPVFDDTDELAGVLQATSPLLRRAFLGTPQPGG
jgi:Protein of unknown function (DUF3499)